MTGRRVNKPLATLIETHAAQAFNFKKRNRQLVGLFEHMLGYPASTRKFFVAIIAGEEAEASTLDKKHALERYKLEAKVRVSLETTFYNSLYAAFRLLSFGMQREAVVLLRNAFEALQYFRLLSFDDAAYDCFESKPLRPVEVRKRLEALGHDPEPIRKSYSALSEMSHLGGPGSLSFDLSNVNSEPIAIGGYVDEESGTEILQTIVSMTHLFQAFALGVSEDNAVVYFSEIRELLNDRKIGMEEKAKILIETIQRHQFPVMK